MFENRTYFTVDEVLNLIFNNTVSKSSVHKMIQEGKIPAVSYCRKKLIPVSWVLKEYESARGGVNVGTV